MYAFLEGILASSAAEPAGPAEPGVVIDVQGVGYALRLGERQRLALPAAGERVRLYTHLVVREDDLSLYGFQSPQERRIFLDLLSVNGVGPKVALAVLGAQNADEVLRAIGRGQSAPLLTVKGIGRKTAERVVLELEEKARAWAGISAAGAEAGAEAEAAAAGGRFDGQSAEAVLALESLGVGSDRAAEVVARVLGEGPVVSVEELLRSALRHLHPEQRA